MLKSEENSDAKKLQSLPIKGSHKAEKSSSEETNKPAADDLNKSLSGLKLQGCQVTAMERSGKQPKQHKTEKRKINNSERGQKKRRDKRKKFEEAEKKPTQYVYMLKIETESM